MSQYEDEGIVDVEKRTKQVNYTLGDPTIFPPEFLAWLKRYIEQSGITLPASAIFGTFTSGVGSVRNLSPGIILAYGAGTAPAGSLACDGAAINRTTYAALFAAIGTTWGVGDGSTTFNLPDLQGRMVVGKGTHVDVDAMGENDGSALADRRPKHKHTVNDSGHTHVQRVNANTGGTGTLDNTQRTNEIGQVSSQHSTDSATTGVTIGPQTASPTDGPAYATVLYVITTG